MEGQSSEQGFGIRSRFWPGTLRSSWGFHSHVWGALEEKASFLQRKTKILA